MKSWIALALLLGLFLLSWKLALVLIALYAILGYFEPRLWCLLDLHSVEWFASEGEDKCRNCGKGENL